MIDKRIIVVAVIGLAILGYFYNGYVTEQAEHMLKMQGGLTTDGGKECLSSHQCQGKCISDMSREDIAIITFNKMIPGKCSRVVDPLGCMAVHDNGLPEHKCYTENKYTNAYDRKMKKKR
ncbi:hypothetical protein ACFLRF_01080 [Candidatus Altiarchaeota archaeon]